MVRAPWLLGLLGQELLSRAAEDSYPIPPGYAIARRIGAPPRALLHAPAARPAEWFTHEDRTEERGFGEHGLEHDQGAAVVGDGPANASTNVSGEITYSVPMDHTMIAAPLAANDTNATNATNASNASNASNATAPPRAVKRNGFMGNPYTGVFVAPLTDRPVADSAGRRLDVSRVKSIACLQRMIKEPDHECDADQLLPGDVNPGLVDSDPPNVHTTPSTSAIMTASDAAALAAKEALEAAELAKAAAEAVKAAEKSHTADVQHAVETASKAAADAAAAAVKPTNASDIEAAAAEAASAAASAAAEAAKPDTDAIQQEAEQAAVAAGTEAVGLNATNATEGDAGAADAAAADAGGDAEAADADAAAEGGDGGSSLVHAARLPKSALLHRLPAQPAEPTVLHHKLRRSQNLR